MTSLYVLYKMRADGTPQKVRSIYTDSAGAKRSATCTQRRLGGTVYFLVYEEWAARFPVRVLKVKNLMSGKEIEIPEDTPLCCDPSSETYWSM